MMKFFIVAPAAALLLLLGAMTWPVPSPSPTTWTLSGSYSGQSVSVKFNQRMGTALYSIQMGGFEFLDSADHGRNLQSAWQLNDRGEGENPTEGGSAADGAGPTSSSYINSASVSGNSFTSSIRPAYWLMFNGQKTSPHTLQKTVTLSGNVIKHQYTMTLVGNHTLMALEGVTGYTPRTFVRFFLIENGVRREIAAPPKSGWQMKPSGAAAVVLYDGSRAIGCRSGDSWYGFIDGWPKFVCAWKWQQNVLAGTYRWDTWTAFGTLDQVTVALNGSGT